MEDTLKLILNELKDLREGQQKFDTRMDSLDMRMGSLDKRMDSLDTQMGSLDMRMDSFDMRMDSFEQSQSRLEEKFDNLGAEMRSSFSHVENKLEQHKDIFQIVSDEIKSTKVDLDYLSAKSGKHDMQLNNLEKKIQS